VLGAGSATALSAQTAREIGVHATVLTTDPTVWLGGLSGAVRPSSRVRAVALIGAGVQGDAVAWRGELLWQFLLTPRARQGVGVYGGGGVGVSGGPDTEGVVVLTVGLEARPGSRTGWAFEVGVGGGVRLSASYRWRRFTARAPGR